MFAFCKFILFCENAYYCQSIQYVFYLHMLWIHYNALYVCIISYTTITRKILKEFDNQQLEIFKFKKKTLNRKHYDKTTRFFVAHGYSIKINCEIKQSNSQNFHNFSVVLQKQRVCSVVWFLYRMYCSLTSGSKIQIIRVNYTRNAVRRANFHFVVVPVQKCHRRCGSTDSAFFQIISNFYRSRMFKSKQTQYLIEKKQNFSTKIFSQHFEIAISVKCIKLHTE